MRNKILELIDDVIPAEFNSQIRSLLKHCIYCTYTDLADENCEPVSKFGGFPSLPPSMEWPEIEGRQLFFVAQFQLESLKNASTSVNIKDRGTLSFFYDDDNGACGTNHRVLLFSEEESKTLIEKKPRNTPPYIFPQKGYRFREGLSIPNSLDDIDHPLHKKLSSLYVDVFGEFDCLCTDLFEDYDQFGGYTTNNYHRIQKNKSDLVVQFNSVHDYYHYLIPTEDGHLKLDKTKVYYTTS